MELSGFVFDHPAWFYGCSVYYLFTCHLTAGTAFYVIKRCGYGMPLAWCALWGLSGGFTEHISPFYPALSVPLHVETILFRIPTAVPLLALAYNMSTDQRLGVHRKMTVFFGALLPGFWISYDFLTQPTIVSVEWDFHKKHMVTPHGFMVCCCFLCIWCIQEIPSHTDKQRKAATA